MEIWIKDNEIIERMKSVLKELSDEKKDSSVWQSEKKRNTADIHNGKIWDFMEKVAIQHPDILKQLNWM